MADNTSVGTIQLDVEVNQNSLDIEMNRLSKVFSNSFKNMFGGMRSQTNNFVKDSIGKINSSFKNFTQAGTGASQKVSKSIGRMNAEYEKTQAQIKKMQEEYRKLESQRSDIFSFYKGTAFPGMSTYEGLEEKVKFDPEYSKLTNEIDKLTAKLDPLINKKERLAETIKQMGEKANNTGNKFKNMGNSAKKAGKSIFKLSWLKKMFSHESKKASNATSNFNNALNRMSRTIVRNLVVYGLIIKGLRGMINYMWSALKTNQQFVHSLNVIRTNLRVAFQPIYDFVLPALNALMKAVATVTTYIAAAISALFGKTYKQSFNAAKNLDNTKKAMAGYGKAAKKAGKEAKGALMGFDEINSLDKKDDADDTDGGGSDGFDMVMPDLATVDISGIEKFKEVMSQIFEPFKLAWESEGQNTINAIKYALEEIKGLVKAIGNSWLEVWTNGTGQEILETILRIIQNIFNLVGNLAMQFTKAWKENEVGTKIIQGILDIFNIVLDTIERITRATADWAKTLDFTPLLNSIDTLLQALAPLTQNIGDGLVWLWKNALLPLAGWVIEDAIPVFLDMLAEALKVLNNVIEALKPLGQWLWDNFLQPLAEWTGGIIVSVLDGIAKGLGVIGDWIKDHQTAVENMAIAVGSFMLAWTIVDLVVEIGGIISALATFIATGGLATTVMSGFAAVMAFITSPITIAVAVIGTLITVGILLYKNWDEVSVWLKETWQGIKDKAEEIWNAVAEFFVNLWEGITTKIKEVWEGIKEFFSSIWEGIKGIFKKNQDDIKEHDEKTWDSIKTKTSEIWNAIKTFLIDKIWNPIKNTAQTIWEGIKKVILDPINQAKTSLEEKWTAIKEYILRKWNEIKEGISSMKDKLVSAVLEPFKIVDGKIKGIIDNAKDWGRNLIGNFVDGIKSMVGKVKEAASKTAGAVADRMGFHSPAKEGPGSDADKWMPNMMEMFADGIQDNIYEVSAAVSATARSIKQGIQPNTDDMATSIGGAISQSMQGVNIGGGDITVIVKVGEDTLTDKVVSNIQRKSRINNKNVVEV